MSSINISIPNYVQLKISIIYLLYTFFIFMNSAYEKKYIYFKKNNMSFIDFIH